MTSTIIRVGSITVDLAPAGFHVYAEMYLKGGVLLRNQDPGFNPAAYSLVCQATELALKAYLSASNVPAKELKDGLGHRLNALVRRAEAEGINEYVEINERTRGALNQAHPYHKAREFIYANAATAMHGYPDLPDFDVIVEFTTRLLDSTRKYVLSANPSRQPSTKSDC